MLQLVVRREKREGEENDFFSSDTRRRRRRRRHHHGGRRIHSPDFFLSLSSSQFCFVVVKQHVDVSLIN